MAGDRADAAGGLIRCASSRALFADLVGGALAEIGVRPSPMATAYLIELLHQRVRAPEPAEFAPGACLAASLLGAREMEGAERIARLRQLGDRALFLVGFFGDSLRGRLLGRGVCGEVGRSAYGSLATALASARVERSWPHLFEELADRFRDFSDVLAEVCERACPRSAEAVEGLYRRYVETGSERDRRRLLRRGRNLPPRIDWEHWQ